LKSRAVAAADSQPGGNVPDRLKSPVRNVEESSSAAATTTADNHAHHSVEKGGAYLSREEKRFSGRKPQLDSSASFACKKTKKRSGVSRNRH
jgi:hypothetical protein